MKRKSLFISFILMICCLLTASSANYKEFETISDENLMVQNDNIHLNNKQDSTITTADVNVTVRDMANYLETKKEHYPISDEFIEKYQQKDGGYIDLAYELGLVVDKQRHEPNQKWHFFDSWLIPSAEENNAMWDESAKSRVYSKLLCPELLLWIYEACEVHPSKVRAAYNVAVDAKTSGTHISTMAKNMRACVPWEDIEKTIIENMDNTYETYTVTASNGEGYTVSNLQTEYLEGKEVKFTINVTDNTKVIDQVKVNGKVISVYTGTTYKFTMPSTNVTIDITLKEKEEDIPSNPITSGIVYNIKYTLPGKTAKLLETSEDIYNTFEYVGEGSGIITSVSDFEYIYGGGRGGSGDLIWYTGNMLKFGTTSVNGYLTLSLNTKVCGLQITGYTTNKSSNVQIGDASSLDWEGSEKDGKTTILTLSNMVIANKDIVETNQTSKIEFTFASTNMLKIATTNLKPIYITSIEFYTSIYEN